MLKCFLKNNELSCKIYLLTCLHSTDKWAEKRYIKTFKNRGGNLQLFTTYSGENKFDTMPILQVFLLTKHVEVRNLYHSYTSTVRDGI